LGLIGPRYRVASPRAAALALAALLTAATPVLAQQSAPSASPPSPSRLLDLRPPTAAIALPPAPRLAAPARDAGCAPQWPCRLRLFGYTGRYGGIGLKAPALTW
jgi:hypothetical protein